MLTVGGGRKMRFNIFLQSFAQLDQKYGKEGAENILDNCHTWIYLRTSSFETANKISKKLGNYTISTYSQSTSYDKSQTNNSSSSMNLMARPLLTEDEIIRIARPYLLVLDTGNFPMITKVPDLSKWHFNELFGMGDEDYNTKLRIQRENERFIRPPKKMDLWGIWNEYKNKTQNEKK